MDAGDGINAPALLARGLVENPQLVGGGTRWEKSHYSLSEHMALFVRFTPVSIYLSFRRLRPHLVSFTLDDEMFTSDAIILHYCPLTHRRD